jgi:ribonuclease I
VYSCPVKSGRSHKAKVALAIVALGALVTWYSARGPHGPARESPPESRPIREETRERPNTGDASSESQAPKFDFYLMVMTWHAAFCADGHDRTSECAAQPSRSLVIHGLWPERLQAGTYPHDCPAPALHLDSALSAELEDYMPGMRANLHEHEWRTHGGCAGLDDDEYFRAALRLARDLDAALSARLTTLAGRETGARELREYADQVRPGLGATLVFQCRMLRAAPAAQRKRPFLVEVRQCVDNDAAGGAPGTLLDCASVARRDQGCGGSFFIAGPRLWK